MKPFVDKLIEKIKQIKKQEEDLDSFDNER